MCGVERAGRGTCVDNDDDEGNNIGEAEAEEVWEVVTGEYTERQVQCQEYAC